MLADAAVFPRDKTCGDGLTPRAIAELDLLGLGDWVRDHTVNRGCGRTASARPCCCPGPAASLPDHGSAVPRTELDDRIRTDAIDAGADRPRGRQGGRRAASRAAGSRPSRSCAATRPSRSSASGWSWPTACARGWARCSAASGTRTPCTPWRGAATSTRAQSDDPWISSHLELRGEQGEVLPGYGWIFPLGDGEVNVGVGTLATTKRPADIAIKPLMKHYTDERRADFGLTGEQRMPTSALLPMGGAVSNVAGANWALIGDAAACVNPLNGEGIDYGLETGRLVVDHLDDRPRRRLAGAAAATTTARRSRSPAGWPASVTVPKTARRARPGRHAQRLADDARAALDGQPRHRRGPRPLGPRLALGRPPLGRDRRAAPLQLTPESGAQMAALATRSAPNSRSPRSRGLRWLP